MLYSNFEKRDTGGIISKFYRKLNMFLYRFKGIRPDIMIKLFSTFCCDFYDAHICYLDSDGLDDICKAWRKGIRKVLGLPPRTHNNLLPELTNTLPLRVSLEKRFSKMACRAVNSDNHVVKNLFLSSCHRNSVVSKNLSHCMVKYHISWFMLVHFAPNPLGNIISRNYFLNVDDNCKQHASFIKELCMIRYGYWTCNLSFDEVQTLLEDVCVS